MFTPNNDTILGELPIYIHNKEDIDYICFTNNNKLKSNFWDIKLIDQPINDPRREARKYKLLPHKFLSNYKNWIWTDSNIYVLYDPKSLINYYLKNHDIAVHKHCDRLCLYDEAKIVSDSNRDKAGVLQKQIDKYFYNYNFPKDFGLYETGILLRRNNDIVKEFNELWYEELNNGSKRDQISFPFVYWKLKDKIRLNAINKTFANHNTKLIKDRTAYFKIVDKQWKTY